MYKLNELLISTNNGAMVPTLERQGIVTLDDLMKLTPYQIAKLSGIGAKRRKILLELISQFK